MSEFEGLLEIEAVGGTTDIAVTASPQDGIQMSVTDAEGNVVVVVMDDAEARRLQNMLLGAANAYRTLGGAA